MPTVMLIAEQQRVQRLFSQMEQERLFRLRLVPTLAQAEEEIATRLPHFVFVEDGISGLSADAIEDLFGRVLPDRSALVLLAEGNSKAVEIRAAEGRSCLDLSEPDQDLKRQIQEMVRFEVPVAPVVPAAPSPAAPQTAREFLFGQADEDGSAGVDKRLIWIVPAAMVLASLVVIVLYPREQLPPAAKPASVVKPGAPPTIPSPKAVQAPLPSSAQAPARPKEKVPEPELRQTYVVQQNDMLLRILRRKYGYSNEEALGVLPILRALNKQSDLDHLTPGQTIIIPVRPGQNKQVR